MTDCTEASSSLWLNIMRLLRAKHPKDKSREAKLGIENAIEECESAEERILEEIRHISHKVKQIPAGKINQQMKNLLTKSRAKRSALHSMQHQKQHLQRQQEALASCELNEKVINTMKSTSGFLKDIGMESQLAIVDETMMDMQENMQNANSITSALAFDSEDHNENDLSDELQALMNDDWDRQITNTTVTVAPPTSQSIMAVEQPRSDTTEILETPVQVTDAAVAVREAAVKEAP